MVFIQRVAPFRLALLSLLFLATANGDTTSTTAPTASTTAPTTSTTAPTATTTAPTATTTAPAATATAPTTSTTAPTTSTAAPTTPATARTTSTTAPTASTTAPTASTTAPTASATAPTDNKIGYIDVDFSYQLTNYVCNQVEEVDCKKTKQRETTMRIYYPTSEAESVQPDNSKDRYWSICDGIRRLRSRSLGMSEGDSVLLNFCVLDNERVYANPNVVPQEGNFPGILLSPGHGWSPLAYTHLTVALVRAGFVVVALSHPLNDAIARIGDKEVNQKTFNTYEKFLLEKGDAIAALNKLEELSSDSDVIFQGMLGEISKGVGYVGHSLGGATAMATSIDDPKQRVRAVVNLDGIFSVIFNGRNFAAELDVPWMVAGSPFIWNTQLYPFGQQAWTTTIPGGGSVAFSIKNSVHDSFTDVCLTRQKNCGTIDPAKMADLISEYTTAFFQWHLENNETARGVLETESESFGAYYYK